MTELLSPVLLAVLGSMLLLGLLLGAYRLVGQRHASTMTMPAAYRAEGQTQWCRGTLRFISGRLVLRGPGGLSVGPWQRGNLDLGVSTPLDEESARALGCDGQIQVPVSYFGSRFELALAEDHYTALRAWIEAVPPGWNSQVA
ncbi:DUF2550 family protein [Ornithinimicrobium pratense]|uniref:DUF2550 family protein n=1 Tax=Ornithinimicrobium pratense TaxID=2593973 RepID=A0A5J6V3H7_9MICO|nr:DUF2550 family protein [Ornithinimicrobium pratense]QFG67836.1 DUF2550 family protein [Ornithinimicrobium pratense]